jgi:hypothetical protein
MLHTVHRFPTRYVWACEPWTVEARRVLFFMSCAALVVLVPSEKDIVKVKMYFLFLTTGMVIMFAPRVVDPSGVYGLMPQRITVLFHDMVTATTLYCFSLYLHRSQTSPCHLQVHELHAFVLLASLPSSFLLACSLAAR